MSNEKLLSNVEGMGGEEEAATSYYEVKKSKAKGKSMALTV